MNYTIETLKKLMAIDSPSGFTKKAAEFTMDELRTLGYSPEMTKKGCVLCCLGGEENLLCSPHTLILSAAWSPRSRPTAG